MQTLLLEHEGSLEADILMTVVPREIHRMYPGKYRVIVKSSHTDIWHNNPFATCIPVESSMGSLEPVMITPATGDTHILQSYLDSASKALSVYGVRDLKLTELRPSVYLDESEMKYIPSSQGVSQGMPYWMVCPGWDVSKSIVAWDASNWQQVVNHVATNTKYLVIEFGTSQEFSMLPRLRFAVDLYNAANLRETMWMLHNARGLLCASGPYMHLAAALGKPCVVIAGNRVPWWCESYSFEMIKRYAPAVDDKYAPLAKTLVAHKYLQGDKPCDPSGKGCYGTDMLTDCKNISPANRTNPQGPRMQQAGCMASIDYRRAVEAIDWYNRVMELAKYDERVDRSRERVADAGDKPGAVKAAIGGY